MKSNWFSLVHWIRLVKLEVDPTLAVCECLAPCCEVVYYMEVILCAVLSLTVGLH